MYLVLYPEEECKAVLNDARCSLSGHFLHLVMQPGRNDPYLKFKARTDIARRSRSRNLAGLRTGLGYLFLLLTAIVIALLVSLPAGEILRNLGLLLIGLGAAIISFLCLRK